MTLAYTYAGTQTGRAEINDAYITATSNDTTATVFGKVIRNDDGRINFMSAMVTATNQTGTSPTLTVTLQGSNDGTNFVDLKDSAGNAIASAALAIGTASTTNVAEYIDTTIKPRSVFPKHLRWKVAVGGSGTPGGTYVVRTTTIRNAY